MKPRQRNKRRMHNVRQCDPVLADIKRGAVAGAMAGGVASLVVTTAVILIRARMGC
ncbi:hypothetical protein NFS79_004581 [Salmonella enterica]|nr:hypothetical protein [Salmonella enterica]